MQHNPPLSLSIALPQWSGQIKLGEAYTSAEARMQLAITLSRMNIEQATGGPFGAAVFDMQTHALLSVGMNLVVSANCSMAHAEMVAISCGQQRLACFDLAAGAAHYELVTSCEPCAMCFGAIPWSGIRHLVCGARDSDARAIGFDEGPKMADWQAALAARGISVETDLCREDAAAILQRYARDNGTIYNGRQE
ncbi:MAG: tRNA-specific adenosine deaminase [Zetaproteobacteria bacterium CG12_big_fil_rev_8_21_14_0_65_54_13]|nr:MAG: tRNA-specific adenosine deaminase [Zetaproteobacteria bacterium CG12_big_fil_rev_8_21_14_0_65_54_13]PIX53264.1 MAG: tRNA-specific adenosine deaminase [Zetaproteobacteria bacterium CG_4_10_14_3_um_filter_54_28]PJA31018.1 MAG: tRNA-specific adenosine deaminase [Zetaproteobacteria bacterium CG_4_9_14_3_um_filter_54_145]